VANVAALFARWSNAPKHLRVAVAVMACVATIVVACAAFLAHPARAPLFANPLQPEQLAEVQERLAGWNVPFTPTEDNAIVDTARRNDLLLRLSLSGVPHEHVRSSSDVLAKIGALTPQTVIDAQTRDGLAGDIQLGLRGIDGIDDARVIIAPAKPGYFADEQSHDASASVRLQLHPGARLSRDAIAGIRAFVAAGVPGLDRSNVTIVDDRGVALGNAGNPQDDAADMQSSLQSALDAALGAGAAIVRVRAEVDERAQQSRDVRRVPLSATAITSAHDSERYDDAGKHYDRDRAQTERANDTRETTISTQAGRLARVSVAILVDARLSIDLYKVRSIASATAGLDARRGDTISVQAIDFAHATVVKKDGWWLAYGAIVPLLPTVAIAFALLVALRWSLRPFARLVRSAAHRARIERTAAAVAGVAPAHVRGALAGEPPHAAAAIISALPAATAAAVLDMYPEHERAAIVRRMQRRHSPLVAGAAKSIADV
jgi:flagellar M-ring protein FliF